jgi:hypothetical protein
MINGEEYAWEDIQVIMEGKSVPLIECSAIEYESKKDHVNVYAAGAKPVAMGRGKEEYSGSITILQSGLEAMVASMPRGKKITDRKAFIISVAYAPEAGLATVDVLKYCRVAALKKGMKTGDTHQEITLPLVIGDIDYNV